MHRHPLYFSTYLLQYLLEDRYVPSSDSFHIKLRWLWPHIVATFCILFARLIFSIFGLYHLFLLAKGYIRGTASLQNHLVYVQLTLWMHKHIFYNNWLAKIFHAASSSKLCHLLEMQLLRRKPNQFCNLNHCQWRLIPAGLKVFTYTFSLEYTDAILPKTKTSSLIQQAKSLIKILFRNE